MPNPYTRLKQEWTGLLQQLCGTPLNELSNESASILKKTAHLEQLAEEIGGSASADVIRLAEDVRKLLSGHLSLAETGRMMEHALRVEQDTREL